MENNCLTICLDYYQKKQKYSEKNAIRLSKRSKKLKSVESKTISDSYTTDDVFGDKIMIMGEENSVPIESFHALAYVKEIISNNDITAIQIMKISQKEWTSTNLTSDGYKCSLVVEGGVLTDCCLFINNLALSDTRKFDENFPLANSEKECNENSWYVDCVIGDYTIIRNNMSNSSFSDYQSFFPRRIRVAPLKLNQDDVIPKSSRKKKKKSKSSKKRNNNINDVDADDVDADDHDINADDDVDTDDDDEHIPDGELDLANLNIKCTSPPNFLDNIYSISKKHQGCYGDSGNKRAFAEVTLGSCQNIFLMIVQNGFDMKIHTICDFGSGFGIFLHHFLERCESNGLLKNRSLDHPLCIGIEVEKDRFEKSLEIEKECIDQNYFRKGQINYQFADFTDIGNLNPITHAYVFDTGMPPWVMQHLAESFNRRYFLS
jgi:hypothetical protein